MELTYWFFCVVFNFTSMQIVPHISLGSNEENMKALTPDEKKMAFEMTHTQFCGSTPNNKQKQRLSPNIGHKH